MFMEGLRKLEYKKYKPRLGGGKVGSDLREGHFCYCLKHPWSIKKKIKLFCFKSKCQNTMGNQLIDFFLNFG